MLPLIAGGYCELYLQVGPQGFICECCAQRETRRVLFKWGSPNIQMFSTRACLWGGVIFKGIVTLKKLCLFTHTHILYTFWSPMSWPARALCLLKRSACSDLTGMKRAKSLKNRRKSFRLRPRSRGNSSSPLLMQSRWKTEFATFLKKKERRWNTYKNTHNVKKSDFFYLRIFFLKIMSVSCYCVEYHKKSFSFGFVALCWGFKS